MTLAATASSGLAVSYSSSSTPICTVSGSTVTTLAAGTCTIVAAQAGNGTYLAATSVSQSFTVSAAPNFTLSLTAPTLTLARATGGSVILSAVPAAGFTGSVTFSETGVPVGVNNGFLATGGAHSNYFIVYVPPGAANGTFSVTLKGVSGAASATVVLTLVIQ